MPKFIRSTLIGTICLMSMFAYTWLGSSQLPQSSVRLTTTPAIQTTRPFEAEAESSQSPVTLSLQAIDATGRPLENAQMHLQILTPPKNPWFTTDFPVVEGTTLLDLTAVAPSGELQVQQMLPIRGNYHLRVEVTPLIANTFTPIQQTLNLPIAENRVKFQNFAILAIILLFAGLVGGWVIGGGQSIQVGEIAPQRVRLLLSGVIVMAIATLLFVNLSAEWEQSHHSMAMSHSTETAPPAQQPSTLTSQGLALQLLGDSTATVGQLANFQVSVTDAQTGQPATDVKLRLVATQEEGWLSLSYEGIPNSTGALEWQQQFFDGAPHQITVEVSPLSNASRRFQPFQVAKTISVEGVAPPLFVRLISLMYMTAIVVLGLLLGLGIQRYRRRSSIVEALQ